MVEWDCLLQLVFVNVVIALLILAVPSQRVDSPGSLHHPQQLPLAHRVASGPRPALRDWRELGLLDLLHISHQLFKPVEPDLAFMLLSLVANFARPELVFHLLDLVVGIG